MKKPLFPILVVWMVLFLQTTAGVCAEIPRPEHPRPDFHRDLWLNLNGEWNFAFDPQEIGETEGWYKPEKSDWPERITVPYPWESSLSGIHNPEYKGTAWYQRRFELPASMRGKRLLLNFGAVDWSAKVWVDGQLVGEHEGGYTPFQFEIRDALGKGNEHVLTVKATDTTRRDRPTGKQVGWYTTTSGIWQTVYLEAVGEWYIEDIRFDLRVEGEGKIRVDLNIPEESRFSMKVLPDSPPDSAGLSPEFKESYVQIMYVDGRPDGVTMDVLIPDPKFWSPAEPNLYFVKLELRDNGDVMDTVHTYFGLREVSTGQISLDDPAKHIFLNRRPFYILSALDQAFHPGGIYTYPSDERIRQDVQDSLDFGFNNLRLHIKADEPRFYYWADRLGLTVLYDFPCTSDFSDEAERTWEKTFREAFARDKNHPSIIQWVLFNETWGLAGLKEPKPIEFVQRMYNLAKELDSTRLVEDNSPCNYDHIVTDVNSWHFYIYDHAEARAHIEEVVEKTTPGSTFNYLKGFAQDDDPLINSEYGGVSSGMGDRDISWCFHYLTNELRRHEKIGGYVYTELQDIEWEHNGFLDYDRGKKVFGYEEFVPVPENHPPFGVRDLNNQDFLAFDAVAGENLGDATEKTVQPLLSLFSGKFGSGLGDPNPAQYRLHWQIHSMEGAGADTRVPQWSKDQIGDSTVSASIYSVNPADPITFQVKPEKLYLLYAWVEDGQGQRMARNFWVMHSLKDTGVSDNGDGTSATATWKPAEPQSTKGEILENPKEQRDCISIPGEAAVTYRIAPKNASAAPIQSAKLLLELAACAGNEKVDWPQKINAPSTPQTEADRKFPSTVLIKVNDQVVKEVELEDDPADCRGVLSNIFNLAPPAGYGFWVEADVPAEMLKPGEPVSVTIETKPGTKGGLRVFGARSGRYPVPPTLRIEYKAAEGTK